MEMEEKGKNSRISVVGHTLNIDRVNGSNGGEK